MAVLESIFGTRLGKYKYTPIPPGARIFRLAKLLPPEPSLIPGLAPTVRISLVEREAGVGAHLPDYDALSYTWDVPPNAGPPSRRIIVECPSGGRFYMNIYRALELALLTFSASLGSSSSSSRRNDVPIFIDQLCIDQESDDEKTQQVPLMQAIYTHCRRAVIWLGPGTRLTDSWFDYVQEVAASGPLCGLMGPRVSSAMRVFDAVTGTTAFDSLTDPQEIEDRDALAALAARLGPSYPVSAYLAVLGRPWFSRLWTIQEACLAPSVVVVCGTRRLCFECVRAGAFFYNVQNGVWTHSTPAVVSRREIRARSAVFDATAGLTRIWLERKAIHKLNRRQPLFDLLIKYSVVLNDSGTRIGASVGQDYIYGLLGLTEDNDPVRTRIGVYYDKKNQTAAQVRAYTELAGIFIEQGHMDVLLFNQAPKKTGGLPSWVPDWAMHLVLPVAWRELYTPLFAAGGPPNLAEARVDPACSSRLLAQGVLVGHIAAIGTATYKGQFGLITSVDVEYGDAKLVFDEVDQFVKAAAESPGSRPPPASAPFSTSLRVFDSGRNAAHFTTTSDTPAAALARLNVVKACIDSVGTRVLRAAAGARAYSIRNIYATVGITPWYADYYRPLAALRFLARGPVHFARTLVLALADLVEDVAGLCLASAAVAFATWRVSVRRRVRPFRLASEEEERRIGLDPAVTRSPELAAFLDNLMHNRGRHVYRTAEGGFVGMGPAGMQIGDAVVVMKGVTTPLVLRRGDDTGGNEEWTLVGEAYCDGVMNGEALVGGNEREFILV